MIKKIQIIIDIDINQKYTPTLKQIFDEIKYNLEYEQDMFGVEVIEIKEVNYE